jgi:hypothetical protein
MVPCIMLQRCRYDLGYTQLTKSFANAATYTEPSFFAYIFFAYTYFAEVADVFVSEDVAEDVQGWFDGSMSKVRDPVFC